MIDKSIRNRLFLSTDRYNLYNKLLKDSGLTEKKSYYENIIFDLIYKVVKEHKILPKRLISIYDNADPKNTLLISKSYINIDVSLFFSSTTDKCILYYPNEVLSPKLTEEYKNNLKTNYISLTSVYLENNYDDRWIIPFDDLGLFSTKRNNRSIFRYISNEELEEFKFYLLKYLYYYFKELNFYIEYGKRHNFLKGKAHTWGDVEKINKDWFAYLVETFGSDTRANDSFYKKIRSENKENITGLIEDIRLLIFNKTK